MGYSVWNNLCGKPFPWRVSYLSVRDYSKLLKFSTNKYCIWEASALYNPCGLIEGIGIQARITNNGLVMDRQRLDAKTSDHRAREEINSKEGITAFMVRGQDSKDTLKYQLIILLA